mgnify:FL=1
MKADEAKELLEERIDFLEYDTPIISTEWIQKQYESISFAIKIIEVFEMSLHDQGAYIVDYKNGKRIHNIGGEEYEI